MKRTTLAIAALLLAGAVTSQPVHAAEGPWCAYETTGTNAYSERCDLPSFEACRAWTQGMAGTWCTQNPRFAPADRSPAARTRRPR